MLTQAGHRERDVRGATTASDVEVIDEERQSQFVELVDDERVGEATREGHQMIGRDRSGDSDPHGYSNESRQAAPARHRRHPTRRYRT